MGGGRPGGGFLRASAPTVRSGNLQQFLKPAPIGRPKDHFKPETRIVPAAKKRDVRRSVQQTAWVTLDGGFAAAPVSRARHVGYGRQALRVRFERAVGPPPARFFARRQDRPPMPSGLAARSFLRSEIRQVDRRYSASLPARPGNTGLTTSAVRCN